MKNATGGSFVLCVVLFLLWVLLTGSVATEELITGFVVAIGASLLTTRSDMFSALQLSPAMPVAIFRYLISFFTALVKANLDLARRVLTPSLPLKPAVVEVETALQSDFGKLLLANSITLTPGTLTVDVLEKRLLIHWIDSEPGADLDHATQAIAADFEQHIKGFLK